MEPDPRLQGSSRSETRALVTAIINAFNETGNPPAARVQHAVPGPPWQNVHIRWKDDGSCVPIARSPLARAPTPGTRANAPESVDHAYPPRPASPTPRDQRKRPREDVPALGDLPKGAATKRKTNGQPLSALVFPSRPLEIHPKRRRTNCFPEEWNPDSDRRLGRIFRLRVDRDGNPRREAIFADDKYPLRWVRLVTTEHQLLFGNRPSGVYAACATEAKNWEAANRAFSLAEQRATKTKTKKLKQIVFYESLDLEFLEAKHDVEYLDLHRYPHPGASGSGTTENAQNARKQKRAGEKRDSRTTQTRFGAIDNDEELERRSDGGFLARLADLAVAATADAAPEVLQARYADENENENVFSEKEPPEAPGSPERGVQRRASNAPPEEPFLCQSAVPPKNDKEASGPDLGGTNVKARLETNEVDLEGSLADRIAPDVPATDENVRRGYVSVPSADAFGDREADLADKNKNAATFLRKKRATPNRAAAEVSPAYVTTAGPKPADPDSSLGVLPADRDLREEVRSLKMRLEHVDCRLRVEREERRLNETRLMAALRESRRALERVRAAVERDADASTRRRHVDDA